MGSRWMHAALLAFASSMDGAAAAAEAMPAPAGPASADATIYVSRLPLDTPRPMLAAEGSQLGFYCRNDQVLASVGQDLTRLAACRADRVTASRNGRIEVVYVYSTTSSCDQGADAALQAQETARRTLFATEAKAIVTAIAAKSPGDGQRIFAADAEPRPCFQSMTYALTQTRADVVLGVSLKGDDKIAGAYDIVTGPPEHWFITGDAIVRGVKELKYDPDHKTVVERDKPSQFYVGFNYMVGDVLGRSPAFSTDRLVVKFLLSPSKNPFDSVGVGIGYRLKDGVYDFKGDGAAKDDVSGGLVLFAGSFWTKNDRLDAATGIVSRQGRSQSWRFGLSYDVSSLLGWLK